MVKTRNGVVMESLVRRNRDRYTRPIGRQVVSVIERQMAHSIIAGITLYR